MSRVGKAVSATIALLGWGALVLQFVLIVLSTQASGEGGWTGAIRFFGYFTILTNILVAAIGSAPWLPERPRRRLSRARVQAGAATYIAMVGIVYTLILRHTWDPQGLQRLADSVLHYLQPVLYVVCWLAFAEKTTLRWRDVPVWLLFPLIYLGITLVSGALSGWYPYPFIHAGELGYGRVLVNIAALIGAFIVLGLVVLAVARLSRRAAGAASPAGRPG